MGELLRSKGFLWIANSHDVLGGWQQAGNVLRMQAQHQWMCEMPEVWEGTPSEDLVMKDILKPNSEEWEFKDRRKELSSLDTG